MLSEAHCGFFYQSKCKLEKYLPHHIGYKKARLLSTLELLWRRGKYQQLKRIQPSSTGTVYPFEHTCESPEIQKVPVDYVKTIRLDYGGKQFKRITCLLILTLLNMKHFLLILHV